MRKIRNKTFQYKKYIFKEKDLFMRKIRNKTFQYKKIYLKERTYLCERYEIKLSNIKNSFKEKDLFMRKIRNKTFQYKKIYLKKRIYLCERYEIKPSNIRKYIFLYWKVLFRIFRINKSFSLNIFSYIGRFYFVSFA